MRGRLLLLIGAVACLTAYLWIRPHGPVHAIFAAAPDSDAVNSVDLTPEIRNIIPDGTARSLADEMLIAGKFQCRLVEGGQKAHCSYYPLGIVCAETWFVSYALDKESRLTDIRASKSTSCL